MKAVPAWLRLWSAYVRWTARWPALAAVVPFVPVVVLWAVVAESGIFPRVFFPGPMEVIRSFGKLMYNGMGLSDRAHKLLWPILLFFQAIGDIAWLPILLIWFGFGLGTMTFVIVYTVLFPIVLNTALGVRSVPLELHRAAQSLGATRARVVWEVVLPGALPNIVTGLRNGLGYGWRALIAAEMIVGTSGIGFLMFDARRAGSVVEIMLGMIVLGILWYIVDSWVLAPIERATGQRWGLVTR